MPARRLNVLGWIVAFKAFKSLSLTAVGIVLLTVRHRDPVDLLMTAALAIHLPLTSRIFARLLAIAVNLTIRQETALALTAFGYAVLMASEGVGLHLRKPWARWFTIGATTSLVPIEVYEILREPHAVRLLVFAANVAIIVYLVKRREAFD
jgi:uncharacterized membrane protein (DUF2068 family)